MFDTRELRSRFWWAVHNGIAHPCIVLLPFRLAFPLHTWTAKKANKADGEILRTPVRERLPRAWRG